MTNRQAHKKMWTWIAKHSEELIGHCAGHCKWVAVAACGLMEIAKNNCFACKEVEEAGQDCSECPITWGTTMCLGEDSLYVRWHSCKDIEEKEQLALQIANGWRKRGLPKMRK